MCSDTHSWLNTPRGSGHRPLFRAVLWSLANLSTWGMGAVDTAYFLAMEERSPVTTARLELVPYADLDSAAETGETALVERLRCAEPQAVGQAYDRHQVAVRSFARRLVGDPTAAEDLVHEVFVSLPRAIRGYRGEASLRTFLISIAVNHARHHVRAAARRRAAMDRLGREPTGHAADPEAEARRHELADALSRALDSLPLDQRIAFVLCEVEERSSHEAASLVGVPEGTIRTRLFHARRKLRDALEQEGVR
jgi:RNA polymerase sigma-70 factor (ECF subfamily)